MGETSKARQRREREGWFDKHVQFPGLDIGCSDDPVHPNFELWDIALGDGDATFMQGIPDYFYMTVYASHVLEHIVDYKLALKNWYRILKPTGRLIINLPHRDLYEKRKTLPSNWNQDHKHFWLPDRAEPPATLCLIDVLRQSIPDANLVSMQVLDEGWNSLGNEVHSVGEYSIEAVLVKV